MPRLFTILAAHGAAAAIVLGAGAAFAGGGGCAGAYHQQSVQAPAPVSTAETPAPARIVEDDG